MNGAPCRRALREADAGVPLWRRSAGKLRRMEVDCMNDLLLLAGFLACWILLQKVILPKLGVPT